MVKPRLFGWLAFAATLAAMASIGIGAAAEPMPGYGEAIDAIDFAGFICKPYPNPQDGAGEPRADIRYIKAYGSTSNYAKSDSIQTYHFAGAVNSNTDPRDAEGPDGQTLDFVSLGPGGFFFAEMDEPIYSANGPELIVAEHVGFPEPFCVYGAASPQAQWSFIGWWPGEETTTNVAFDLEDQYTWNSKTNVLTQVLVVDAHLQGSAFPDFTVAHEEATNVTGAPGFQFHDLSVTRGTKPVSWLWDFGDGAFSDKQHPLHAYDASGTYQACMQLTYGTTSMPAVCRNVTVVNRPPESDPRWVYQDANHVSFDGSPSADLDGHIVTWHWEFYDGATSSLETPGMRSIVGDEEEMVCLTVTDNEGAIGKSCKRLSESSGSPPQFGFHGDLPAIVGQPFEQDLDVTEIDGQSFNCEIESGPGDATVEDCILRWTPDTTATVCITILAVDLSGKEARAIVCVQPVHSSPDQDDDGVDDHADNCPGAVNLDQADSDGDGIGDACDETPTSTTAAPAPQAAPEEDAPLCTGSDQDYDGVPDDCDGDIDGDGISQIGPGTIDNCPWIPNPIQRDADGDGIGDLCEPPEPLSPSCQDACRRPVTLAESCRDCDGPASPIGRREMAILSVGFAGATLMVALGTVLFLRRRGPA